MVHLVFELCGASVGVFRVVHGCGRNAAQPPHHVRMLLTHVLRALYFLHTDLATAHNNVKLAHILVKFTNNSLSRGIDCKLADFGSVGEVASFPFTVARKTIKQFMFFRVCLCFFCVF